MAKNNPYDPDYDPLDGQSIDSNGPAQTPSPTAPPDGYVYDANGNLVPGKAQSTGGTNTGTSIVDGAPPTPAVTPTGSLEGDTQTHTDTGSAIQTANGQLSAADKATIDGYLSAAGSTDDPGYWYALAAKQGGVAQTGADWLQGRINQGNGAAAVRNGTVQPFQDSTTPPPAAGGAPAPAQAAGNPLQDFLTNLLGKVAAGPASTGQRSDIVSQLLAQAKQLGQPVTADDPVIKSQTDAYSGATDRALSQYQMAAAERAHAEGVPTGAFDSQIGNATMQAGQAKGSMTSQLMSDELNSRRSALVSTLSTAGSQLSAQDQADLQGEIAAIDASLGQQGADTAAKNATTSATSVGNTFDLGQQGLDLQKLLGLSSLDLQKLLGTGSLANQKQGLDQQNNQFYDQFAYNQTLDPLLQTLLSTTSSS